MNIRNCKKCGAIFQYVGTTNLCQTCIDKDEEDFQRVKEYLSEHSRATISQVSQDLEIRVEKIRSYIREGRIDITTASGGIDLLQCDSCGASISKGRFCNSCQGKLLQGINQAGEDIKSGKSNAPKESNQPDLKKAYRFVKND